MSITLSTYHGKEYLNNELGNAKSTELQSKLNATREYQDFTFVNKNDSVFQIIGKIALAVVTLTASLWVSLLADNMTKNQRVEKLQNFEIDFNEQINSIQKRLIGDYKRCKLVIDGTNVSRLGEVEFQKKVLIPLTEDLRERFGPVKTLQILDGITQTSGNSTAYCNLSKIKPILNPKANSKKELHFTGSSGLSLKLNTKKGTITGKIDASFATAPNAYGKQTKLPVSMRYRYDLKKLEGVSLVRLNTRSNEINNFVKQSWNFYSAPLQTAK